VLLRETHIGLPIEGGRAAAIRQTTRFGCDPMATGRSEPSRVGGASVLFLEHQADAIVVLPLRGKPWQPRRRAQRRCRSFFPAG